MSDGWDDGNSRIEDDRGCVYANVDGVPIACDGYGLKVGELVRVQPSPDHARTVHCVIEMFDYEGRTRARLSFPLGEQG